MKYLKKLTALALAAMLLVFAVACSKNNNNGSVPTAAPGSDATAEPIDDPSDDSREATGAFSIVPVDGGTCLQTGNVYTISAGGEYTVSGRLADGQIVVNAGNDDEVKLTLSNASITCTTGAPIVCMNANELTVKSEEKTYNVVRDSRSSVSDEETYDAAIWSDCDLKLSGKGILIVTSAANGVKTKDDMTVKNVTLKVTSEGVALKGNDSITVESGELILTSTAADGMKTSNSDVSKKGNQKGTVKIISGRVDIYAAQDGIVAAYDCEIIASEECSVNIYTSAYASSANNTNVYTELYLAVPATSYSEGYDYYFCFYNDDDAAGTWVKAEYETKIYSGRTAAYYGLKADIPSGYQNMLVNIVPAGTVPDGTNYTAATGGETVNTSMNCYLITNISSGVITGDWATLSSGGNSDKSTYSSKGIKAGNEILISGGAVTVMSMDDGLHANSGELDSGSTSTGSVTISGGSLTVTCADDGIHADSNVTITDGYVNIKEAHEGIEANVITIGGGSVSIYGKDDGMNAAKGAVSPLVSITGGYVEVTTPSGDTDAIDSNGSFTMSGGFVLGKGGAAMGGMAGSVDVDGSITVSGGTIVALGGICETPANGSVCTYISSDTSFAAGSYTVTDGSGNTLFSFELSGSYRSCWIASDTFSLNGSYAVNKDGSALLSWTQSSNTVGSAGNGGMGGWGGRR
ncbi:MAG: carbohydrate-binding domain-containing protein [Clostridia bacterium]|nr:carbohydrate-binding domain-containing protein [Clostridia bacterium]